MDGHPKLTRFIEVALKKQHLETDTAVSGQQALEKAMSDNFDVMLLDVRLPDMDGFEVLLQLRKFSRLPVIAYSATPEYNARALECGADAFIAKPFDVDMLIDKIRELINY